MTLNRKTLASKAFHPLGLAALCVPIVIALFMQTAYAQPAECGVLRSPGQHGPFDYRKVTQQEKDLVENHHFHIEYRAFLLGQDYADATMGRMPVGSGFDYTLRAFPNHHLALSAMDRLSIRYKKDNVPGVRFTARCWFERAVAFTPDDPLVRALFGIYFSRRGEAAEAQTHLQLASEAAANDAAVQIQIAFAYMNLKRYEEARTHAKRAYELGYPLYGIREQLKALGQWK